MGLYEHVCLCKVYNNFKFNLMWVSCLVIPKLHVVSVMATLGKADTLS